VIISLLILAQLNSVQFYTRVQPETVYVGQQVTYDAVTLVDRTAQASLQSNPEYTPPEIRGATVYDFRFDTTTISNIVLRGTSYRRFVYRRALFPLTEGEFEIPPATLRYSLSDPQGYFGGQNSFTLNSQPVRFVAKALPLAGKPVDFNGVVGIFSDTAFITGQATRVGEPFTLTLRVLGVGNITLLPRPPLFIDWADVLDSDERVAWDSTGSVVRGYKEFDWIVVPKIAGALFIPTIRYDFFNPTTRQYTYAAAPSIRVNVAEAGKVLADSYRPSEDTIGTSPFPAIMRVLREHWMAAGAITILVVFLIIFSAIRAASRSRDE
jgi:hypothetical protein